MDETSNVDEKVIIINQQQKWKKKKVKICFRKFLFNFEMTKNKKKC